MASQKKKFLIAGVAVAAILLVAGGGLLVHQHRAGGFPFAGGASGQVYTCPMHPYYTSDRPGECPICGMDLVPVKAKDEHAGHESHAAGFASLELDPRRQQLIGVTTAPVERKAIDRTVRAVGTVVPDERRVFVVHSKVSGWIDRLYVDATGEAVAAGQPLLAIYSPEVYATEEEYLVASEAARELGSSRTEEVARGTEALKDAAARRLEYWDVGPGELERLAEAGRPLKALTIRSPYSGYVMAKHAQIGMYVQPGMPLYSVADLSRVWVEADLYEYEIPFVEVGQPVTITLPYYPAEPLEGTVRFVYPFLNAKTRTARVRVEVANPGLKLKPDMFADISIAQDLGEQLVVPSEAVLDSGKRKIVFVARDGGHFEPREVTVAARLDEYYVVAGGLREGEEVVTSGNFLLDSESRIKGALAAMAGEHQH
ncbi:MAG TPA: efflux RND transporter periplasmic adaptor subunit [bacterium]|nr:efflux RND transporter periplasmic adaptor subunit [bacterium]